MSEDREQRTRRGRYGDRRAIPTAPPGREPPHSSEAEEHVLACCWLDGGESVVRALREGVTAESFYLPANRLLWEITAELHGRGVVVAVEPVVAELTSRRQIEGVGGLPHLMQVAGRTPTTLQAGYFIAALREKELLRAAVREATAIVEGAYAYSGGGLAEYGPFVGSLQKLEEIKTKGRGDLPPVLAWGEFMPKEQSKLPDELVAGVLHRGAKLMIAGGSKSFKTWVLLHLGLAVATGTPWWGMRVVQGRVLYVNMELMREFCEGRVRALKQALKIEEAAGFDSWHLRGYARDFKELLPHFVAQASRGRYSLIILDPVYKILGERDENANGEVAQLLNEFEALAVRSGAAVAYGHHHSKGNQSDKDAKDRSSGAGAWTRDPDALVDLTPHEEPEHFTATFTLRNHAPKPPMVIQWEFPVMSIAPDMDPTALRKPGRTKEHGMADVVTILMGRDPGLTYGEWETEARRRGVSESTFKRLLKQAMNAQPPKVEKFSTLYRLPKKLEGAA